MCNLCEKKPVYEFTNQRKLCKTCFVRWFQKKVLYTIRKFEMIKKNEVIGYDNSGFRGIVLEDVLKMFAEKSIVELAPQAYPEESSQEILTKGIKLPSKKKLDKIAIASTTDLEANKIIHTLIRGGKKLESAVDGRVIKPLYLFLDKEVLLYTKLRGLKFGDVEEKRKDNISLFIDEMEKLHPEVKQAVIASYLG